MVWFKRVVDVAISFMLFGLSLLFGALIYDYYFVPTNLTICLEESVDVVDIKLERFWGRKEYHMKTPDSGNVVRFQRINKGWWMIVFIDKNGYRLNCQ